MGPPEPAGTEEQAQKVVAKARGIVRQWWWQWVWLGIAVFGVPRMLSRRSGAVGVLDILTVILPLAFALWFTLNRRRAARVLEVNRERWGDL